MTGGFIVIHRKLFDWEWYGQPEMTALWIHLLLSANWEEGQWRGQVVERGSFITTLSSLSKETGLSIQQVRTGLKKLQNSTQINIQTTREATKITICNYDTYQCVPHGNQQTTNARDNTQITQDKEGPLDAPSSLFPETLFSSSPLIPQEEERKKEVGADAHRSKASAFGPTQVLNLWKEICVRCRQPRGLSKPRIAKINARLSEMGPDPENTIRELFKKVNDSNFLALGSGSDGHENWRVDIDFVFANGNNWLRILEGSYDNNKQNSIPGGNRPPIKYYETPIHVG